VKLIYAALLGATGRLIMSGRDAEALEGYQAALEALQEGA
jgi:hypothetical protein